MEGHGILYADYCNDVPTIPQGIFCVDFRMNKELCMPLVHDLREYDSYFVLKKTARNIETSEDRIY